MTSLDRSPARARSRSAPREEGTNAPPTRKWTKSFDNWMRNSLAEQPADADAFNMYRRALRAKNTYLEELLAGVRVDEPDASSYQSWALGMARKEHLRDEKEAKDAVAKANTTKDKDKKRKIVLKATAVKANGSKDDNVEKEKEEASGSKDVIIDLTKVVAAKVDMSKQKSTNEEVIALALPASGVSEDALKKVQDAKVDMSNQKSTNEEVIALALPASGMFQEALKNVQDAKDRSIEQEDIAIASLGALEKKKKDLLIQKLSMDKSIATMTAAAKKIPSIQTQVDSLKSKRTQNSIASAKNEVELPKAKDRVKTARAEVKKMEKEEAAISAMVHRDNAETHEEDTPSETKVEIDNIFELMDRTSSGKVNKRDFIKSLEHDEVALFFELPSKILPEDGSRSKMEAVFQKIATDDCEFDIAELKAVYGAVI